MVFKLLRADTEEACKIQLPSGTHMIGRGKFLDCNDKRVSRNHGELEVTEDTINIKALHQNPIFYTKKGVQEVQILKLNSTVDLSNGDKFGLLPDSYWYEILHCSMLDTDTQPEIAHNLEANGIEERSKSDLPEVTLDAQVFNSNDTVVDGCGEWPSLIPTQRVESPSLTQPQSRLDEPDDEEWSFIQSIIQNDSSTQNYEANDEAPTEQPSTSSKRCHSPADPGDSAGSADEPKRVKVEPIDEGVKQEPIDVKPGPSNDQNGASNTGGGGDGKSPAPPTGPGRERCMYKANCYRKNPQHRVQFSHPGDTDYGSGELGVCPWGRGCLREDPRHWRDHSHPPGTLPPSQPNLPGMRLRTVQKHGNIFYINAQTVNFYDDHFEVEDSDGDSVDFDYEF